MVLFSNLSPPVSVGEFKSIFGAYKYLLKETIIITICGYYNSGGIYQSQISGFY